MGQLASGREFVGRTSGKRQIIKDLLDNGEVESMSRGLTQSQMFEKRGKRKKPAPSFHSRVKPLQERPRSNARVRNGLERRGWRRSGKNLPLRIPVAAS